MKKESKGDVENSQEIRKERKGERKLEEQK